MHTDISAAYAPGLMAGIAGFCQRLDDLDRMIKDRFDGIENRVGAIENVLDSLKNIVGAIGNRLGAIESRIDATEAIVARHG
ncbi:hypothetical protein BDN70DRAFT_884199, partial [Pholiota conissans]